MAVLQQKQETQRGMIRNFAAFQQLQRKYFSASMRVLFSDGIMWADLSTDLHPRRWVTVQSQEWLASYVKVDFSNNQNWSLVSDAVKPRTLTYFTSFCLLVAACRHTHWHKKNSPSEIQSAKNRQTSWRLNLMEVLPAFVPQCPQRGNQIAKHVASQSVATAWFLERLDMTHKCQMSLDINTFHHSLQSKSNNLSIQVARALQTSLRSWSSFKKQTTCSTHSI